jgi:hypothetical protein
MNIRNSDFKVLFWPDTFHEIGSCVGYYCAQIGATVYYLLVCEASKYYLIKIVETLSPNRSFPVTLTTKNN